MNLQSRRALLKQFAPQYHQASSAQKRVLLDTFAQVTGYHRRYGMCLLNHAEEVLSAPGYRRASQYVPEVQQALFLIWHAANRICAKRLIPFLPTLIEALERNEHLHISEECRRQLLSMSAATADRLLRSQLCWLHKLSAEKIESFPLQLSGLLMTDMYRECALWECSCHPRQQLTDHDSNISQVRSFHQGK